jgi:DNA phosphorothioation-dependent restriction protein DptF
MNAHPLITTLQKLKESSRFAVAQGGKYDLDDFKEYLHIEREVESKLKQIIIQSSGLSSAQLILVCGNVGDGKSHILSYLHNEIPIEIKRFQIHNDATESHNPNESSNDTLYRVLNGFKDENIDQSTAKIILAINLGTLSKFIEEHGGEFQNLHNYIKNQYILDTAVVSDSKFDPESHFHQINFTDYHLYSLTENGPISSIISDLLLRIVGPSEKNIIYQAYDQIKGLPEFKRCPVILNYQFLFHSRNRELIVQLIIQSIAQNKEIVSVRSVLNFIHDLIVPVSLSTVNESDIKNVIGKLTDIQLIQNLVPNYIFEHADLSNIFSRLAELDPCNYRADETDELLLILQGVDDKTDFFKNHLDQNLYTDVFQRTNIEVIEKEIVSKYFMRLLFFQTGGEKLKGSDFNQFIVWLYQFNKGNTTYLGKLYELVENAVKKWYGDPKKGDKVVVKVGRRQVKYRVFKDFSLTPRPYVPNKSEDAVLHQFIQEFIVAYTRPSNPDEEIKIAIDYSLFKTLKMINHGYRPNKKDNNNFVYFVYFINEVTQGNQRNNTLYIDKVNIGKPIDYKLTKSAFGEYKFEMVS